MVPFVYRNNQEKLDKNNYLEIQLKGEGLNTGAIGASVTCYFNQMHSWAELYPMRGFQSSMDSRLHFGLANSEMIDSIIVSWPDGKKTVKYNIAANQFLTIDQKEDTKAKQGTDKSLSKAIFTKINPPKGLQFTCKENEFNDFDRDRLLYIMSSNEGPHVAVADLNGDKLDDLYVCGARGESGRLMVQDNQGQFKVSNIELLARDSLSEDTDCAFFDADGDHDQDLYVTSGGNEFSSGSSALRDRFYINDGHGNFKKSPQGLPTAKYESSSCVKAADYDNDGDIDLFVGIRLIPFNYGVPANGYLLENDGYGKFKNISDQKIPALSKLGMITCMEWVDIDNDRDQDIVIAGDWMPIKLFINNNGENFTDASDDYGLQHTAGWWHSMTIADINKDGKSDIVLGNHGLNSFFKTSEAQPVTMVVNDFDMNGSVEQIISMIQNNSLYPVAMKDDLISQIPSLTSKYPNFSSYKDATIQDMFAEPLLNRSLVLKALTLQSCILINNGEAPFTTITLPEEAQWSPVYAILADDFDYDGFCDLLLGGNQHAAKPQTGIYAASYGLLLKGDSKGNFKPMTQAQSGISIPGQIRDFQMVTIKNKPVILMALNNEPLLFYEFQQ